MQTVHTILNTLAAEFGKEMVKSAVRGWIGIKDAEEFLAANPHIAFTNQGISTEALGAALTYTVNRSGHGSLTSGIQEVDPEVSAAAEALAGLAVASSAGRD